MVGMGCTDAYTALDYQGSMSALAMADHVARREWKRASEAERSASRGCCQQCGEPFRGRADKRFCSDACRTRFSREKRDREMAETIRRLSQLAGLESASR